MLHQNLIIMRRIGLTSSMATRCRIPFPSSSSVSLFQWPQDDEKMSFSSPHSQQKRDMNVLSKDTKKRYEELNYTKRMKAKGMPVSPHVTIYAFPMAAITSITNRVTGVMLSFGCAGLATLELLGGAGTSVYVMNYIGSYPMFIVPFTAKFAVAFPVFYHYLGAVRHYAWDIYPEMLTNVDVEKTSYALLGASTALSAGIALL